MSLPLAKLASGTSPQKPPATYTRVNDFAPYADLIFRGDLYARATYTRVYTVVTLSQLLAQFGVGLNSLSDFCFK